MENTTLIGKNSVNRTITGLILLNLLVILVITKSLYENRLSNEHRAKASIEILSHSLEKDIADTFSKIDIILQVIAEKSTQLSTDDSKWNKELENAQKRIPIVKSLRACFKNQKILLYRYCTSSVLPVISSGCKSIQRVIKQI